MVVEMLIKKLVENPSNVQLESKLVNVKVSAYDSHHSHSRETIK